MEISFLYSFWFLFKVQNWDSQQGRDSCLKINKYCVIFWKFDTYQIAFLMKCQQHKPAKKNMYYIPNCDHFIRNTRAAISEQTCTSKKYVLLSGSLEEQLLLTMKSPAFWPKSQLFQQKGQTLNSRLHHNTMAWISELCPKIILSFFLLRNFMIQSDSEIKGISFATSDMKNSLCMIVG